MRTTGTDGRVKSRIILCVQEPSLYGQAVSETAEIESERSVFCFHVSIRRTYIILKIVICNYCIFLQQVQPTLTVP